MTISLVGDLLSSLSHAGVVTSPDIIPIQSILPGLPTVNAGSNASWTKLDNDMGALETELQTLAAKSGLTISDLQSLTVDTQAILQTGFRFSPLTLNPVIFDLATAVAIGSTRPVFLKDFSALFSGSSVSASVIDKTFSDVVRAIQDSNVTLTDVTTVASEEAAIRTDLSNLGGGDVLVLAGSLNLVQDASIVVSVPPSVGAPPVGVSLPPVVVPSPITLPPIQINPPGSTDLLASLSYTGVVTSPVALFNPAIVRPVSSTGVYSRLVTDVEKLQIELGSLAAKSDVTIADLESLTLDGKAVLQAGFKFDPQTLNPVISELAAALAGGSSSAAAQKDFTALFSGSNVSTTVINTTFTDLVKTIKDSKVNPTDLSTVASEEAAIQTDLKNLDPGNSGGTGSGGGTTGGGTGGGGTTGSSNGTGSTGTSTGSGSTGTSSGNGSTGTSSGTGSTGTSTGTGSTGTSSGTESTGTSSGTGSTGTSSGAGQYQKGKHHKNHHRIQGAAKGHAVRHPLATKSSVRKKP